MTLFTLFPSIWAEAALGVDKEIPTLEGDSATLKIPQGTQHGAEFRVRGRGISHINNGRKGDLRVFVDVQVPGKLNGKQRKLLRNLPVPWIPTTGRILLKSSKIPTWVAKSGRLKTAFSQTKSTMTTLTANRTRTRGCSTESRMR